MVRRTWIQDWSFSGVFSRILSLQSEHCVRAVFGCQGNGDDLFLVSMTVLNKTLAVFKDIGLDGIGESPEVQK